MKRAGHKALIAGSSQATALHGLLSNIPLGWLGKPADVAGAAVFLASADADCIRLATIFVDGD